VVGWNEQTTAQVANAIRDALENDEVIIPPGSRQAIELTTTNDEDDDGSG